MEYRGVNKFGYILCKICLGACGAIVYDAVEKHAMAKAEEERPINAHVPRPLREAFDCFHARQGGIDKKVLVAWAIYEFMQRFDIADSPRLRDQYEEWLRMEAPKIPMGRKGQRRKQA